MLYVNNKHLEWCFNHITTQNMRDYNSHHMLKSIVPQKYYISQYTCILDGNDALKSRIIVFGHTIFHPKFLRSNTTNDLLHLMVKYYNNFRSQSSRVLDGMSQLSSFKTYEQKKLKRLTITNKWSKMTLNYMMKVERYPNRTEWFAVRFPVVKSSLYLTNKENQPSGQVLSVFQTTRPPNKKSQTRFIHLFYIKVDNPCLVTFLNCTPTFEWCNGSVWL